MILTNFRRNVFSRSAPMHPAKPKMNITPPTTRKSHTGSKPPRSVMEEMLDRTPWRKRRTENKALDYGTSSLVSNYCSSPKPLKKNIGWHLIISVIKTVKTLQEKGLGNRYGGIADIFVTCFGKNIYTGKEKNTT